MNTLAPTIRAIRKRRGETVYEFGALLGVNPSTVSKYELGKAAASRPVLLALYGLAETDFEKATIARALQRNPSDLDVKVAQFRVEADRVAGELKRILIEMPESPETRRRFADLVLDIAREPQISIDVIFFLGLWMHYRYDPAAQKLFHEAVARLDAALAAISKAGSRPPAPLRVERFRKDDRPRRVMIRCPQTGKPVFTGTEATREQFETTDFAYMETMCPHCYSPHTWTRSGMYLEDSAPG